MNHGNELLLSCLRNDTPEAKIARLRNLQEDDWSALLNSSLRSKAAPLLYHTLGAFHSNISIPSHVQQKLRDAYHRTAARNMRIYRQLLRLVTIFNNENIPVILLKGAHLAKLVYENDALRPMGDLDLLVRSQDLQRVSALLVAQGYMPSRQDPDKPLDVCHLPPFERTESCPIEIHFNIVDPPFSRKFDVDELWERARRESIQGVEVLTLCPADLLLHICIHSSVRHGFDNGIQPLIDIACTLEHYQKEIDWDQLLTRGMQWGAIRCVYVMLALSEKMLGVPIHGHVITKITPGSQDFDVITSAEQLMFEKSAPMASNVARLFRNDSNWLDKFKLFCRRAFPPPETMPVVEGWSESKFSTLIMYFVRITGVWKRHSKTVWQAMWNDSDASTTLAIENRRNRLKDWLEEKQ